MFKDLFKKLDEVKEELLDQTKRSAEIFTNTTSNSISDALSDMNPVKGIKDGIVEKLMNDPGSIGRSFQKEVDRISEEIRTQDIEKSEITGDKK